MHRFYCLVIQMLREDFDKMLDIKCIKKFFFRRTVEGSVLLGATTMQFQYEKTYSSTWRSHFQIFISYLHLWTCLLAAALVELSWKYIKKHFLRFFFIFKFIARTQYILINNRPLRRLLIEILPVWELHQMMFQRSPVDLWGKFFWRDFLGWNPTVLANQGLFVQLSTKLNPLGTAADSQGSTVHKFSKYCEEQL